MNAAKEPWVLFYPGCVNSLGIVSSLFWVVLGNLHDQDWKLYPVDVHTQEYYFRLKTWQTGCSLSSQI